MIIIDTRLTDDRRRNGAGGSAPPPRVRPWTHPFLHHHLEAEQLNPKLFICNRVLQSLCTGIVKHLRSLIESLRATKLESTNSSLPRVNLSAILYSPPFLYSIGLLPLSSIRLKLFLTSLELKKKSIGRAGSLAYTPASNFAAILCGHSQRTAKFLKFEIYFVE